MIKISPSILSCDFANLGVDIKRLDKSSAEYIHIDVMDGHFVPNLTFGPPVIKALRSYTEKIFDVHLMISNPQKFLDDYIESGADILMVHHQIKADKIDILKYIRSKNIKSGIVFNPDISIEKIEDYFPYVDQILLMSVFPGFGGQKFIEASLERGAIVSEKIKKSGYDIDLEIDGGVNLENVGKIKEAGFNVLVSGSTIFKSVDIETVINDLKTI